jgi:hypothetical protein|nr:MAG TPA: hypothetical protein [Caudoviricetes sp.]
MYENLFNLIDDLQKAAMKIKVQEVLNALCADERVHEILDADIVLEYYEKMHEHFEKNPKDFLFPNREWLRESLKRLKVDLSNIFDKDANVDHIKQEEVIVLFILLWIHMVIQNPIRIEVIKDPYDLFYIWTKNRVFISRPTGTHYLQDGDHRVLDRLGKSYGWFTGVNHFSIGTKGAVEYHHSSPDDITNIDGAYNKAHGSVTKLRSNFKGFSFGRSDKNSVRYMMNWAQDRTDKLLTELADNFLEEKHRSHNIARNTKFVVREMTGMSNKDYKAFLKKFKEKEVMRYDETSQCFEDILKISSLEFNHEVILEAVDVYNRNVYHLNKALLKLQEKLNEEKN